MNTSESVAAAMEREYLYQCAIKRVCKNPEAFGAIGVEDAILEGFITADELTEIKSDPALAKEIWAEAEISWRAEALLQGA